MAKAKKMLSAVLAALMVVLSVASYVPAQAAKAVNVPKLQMVTQPEKEYKNGDRVSLTVTSPNYGGQVEYRVILWNGTTKKQSELWPTHKGYYYQNWKPAGSYKFTIHWPVEGMEPGAYSLTVLTRRANSKVAYDSFVKTEAFWVKNETVTIAPIADITVNEGEKVTLPETVTLKMSDDTTKEAKVTWDAVDTAKPGEYTVNGTVEGIETKATVKVIVKAADLAVDSVSAISNTKVEVILAEPASEGTASNIKNYEIVEKGTTTALEVKKATAEASDVVVLETAAQTAGKSYAMTVKGETFNFAGVALDKAAPQLSKVDCVDTNTVDVTFTKKLDKASAETIANYTINNSATIVSASLSSDRKVVTLKTNNVANNKLYTLKIANVKSIDDVTMTAANRNFIGKIDNLAAKLTGIRVTNNTRLVASFSDVHGVDKASATNIANYSIMTGDDALAINSIVAKDVDQDGYYDAVEIVTDTMAANKLYKLTINNLADGSASANVIAKPITKEFRGVLADKTAPTVDPAIVAVTNTMVEVTINEKNALDAASVTDLANYEFNNDLTVVKAEIKAGEKPYQNGYTTIVLTTSEQTAKKNYSLTIKGIKDEFGNELKPVSGTTYRKYYFTGKGIDLVPPFVKSVISVDNTTVKVVFDDRIDSATANDPTNYVFNNGLGAALSATLKKDGVTVVLETPAQVANKSYKVTINGVKDLSGNMLSNITGTFVAVQTALDTDNPQVLYVEALYKDEVKVYFDEPIKFSVDPTMTATYADGTVNFTYAGILDDTTLIMKPNTNLENGKVYTVTAIANVKDYSNNSYSVPTVKDTFVGNDLNNIGPSIVSWEQTDVNTIRVYFDEPIKPFTDDTKTGDTIEKYGTKNVGTQFTAKDVKIALTDVIATADPDGEGSYEGLSTVDFAFASGKLIADKEYNVDFTAFVTDLVGTEAIDETDTDTVFNNKTTIKTYLVDDEKPYITGVVATRNNQIKVTFNEYVTNAGSFRVSYVDNNGNTRYVQLGTASVPYSYSDYATIPVVSPLLTTENNYKLVPISGAADVAGNRADIRDVEWDFVGSDVNANDTYIKGVEIVDADTLTVSMSAGSTISTTISVYLEDDDKMTDIILDHSKIITDGATATFDLKAPLLANTNYVVDVNGKTYTFTGITPDGGIRVYDKEVTFSGYDVETYSVKVVKADGTVITPVTTTGKYIIDGVNTGDNLLVIVTRTSDNTIVYANQVDAE